MKLIPISTSFSLFQLAVLEDLCFLVLFFLLFLKCINWLIWRRSGNGKCHFLTCYQITSFSCIGTSSTETPPVGLISNLNTDCVASKGKWAHIKLRDEQTKDKRKLKEEERKQVTYPPRQAGQSPLTRGMHSSWACWLVACHAIIL